MHEPATLVVLSHSRPDNIPSIVEVAIQEPRFRQVILYHQGEKPLPTQAAWPERVRVWNAGTNSYTFGRFIAAGLAYETDLIATHDDDNIPRNWNELFAAYESAPDRIAAALVPGHLMTDKKRHWQSAHEVLMGWGGLFRQEWVEKTFDVYIRKYGPDEVFVRKADRLFSILLNRPHTVIPAKVTHLAHEGDKTALYRRKDHDELTREARRRALTLLGVQYTESDIKPR